MPKVHPDEVEHVAQALLHDVYQGDETKLGACRHLARVAVRAHWDWGDDDGHDDQAIVNGPPR